MDGDFPFELEDLPTCQPERIAAGGSLAGAVEPLKDFALSLSLRLGAPAELTSY